MTLLADLHEKVRNILKASGEKKAVVPTDPGDPDELQPDYRVGKASPTKGDLDKAENEDEESGLPKGDGKNEPVSAPKENRDPDAGDDEEDEDDEDELPGDDGEGRPLEKGFDEFGNKDLTDEEVREVLKSYSSAPNFGIETNPIPQNDLLTGGVDLKNVLDDVMALILHQQEKLDNYSSVMSDLKDEIARMKKGMDKHEREIAKAFDVLGDPKTALAALPRAINKALPEPPAAPLNNRGETLANQIFSDMKAGRIDSTRAMALCREARV